MTRMKDEINDFMRLFRRDMDRFMEGKLARFLYVGQVEDIVFDDTMQMYKLKVTRLHDGESVDNVKLSGVGLGNYAGIYKVPKRNDFGIVISLMGEPFWVANVYDVYTENPDRTIKAKESMLIQNKEAGSFYISTKNDNIAITTKEGGKIIFLKDGGGFKLFDKDNYGIESDGNGNITIRGNTIDHTQTKGVFDID